MNSWLKVACCGFVIFATGCSWFGDKPHRIPGPDIADLVKKMPSLKIEEDSDLGPVPTSEEVLVAYEKIYGSIADLSDNAAVGKRLADLKMAKGEQADIDGETAPYDDAKELYEQLLSDTALDDQDQVLYQLARAHDVQGQGEAATAYLDRLVAEHPDSEVSVEARFRRAELHFSNGRYPQASADYAYVVKAGKANRLWQNASYMLGWSEFKRSNLDEALTSFFSVIASVAPASDKVAELSPIQKELLGDSLRVVTLALGYLNGPETLAEHMAQLDHPQWQYLAYEHLANDYVENERFLDSVMTWQTFVEQNPLDMRAPNAHIGMINTLVEADFPSEVRPKKEEFVQRYGVFSPFWQEHDETARQGYIATLKVYLDELAALAHSEAQQVKAGSRQRKGAYLAAAKWYEEIIATFSDDPALAPKLFLLAEVYTEAEEHMQAVTSYQRVAREFPQWERANEAGYAAILGIDALVTAAGRGRGDTDLSTLQAQKITAQIEFAKAFSSDQRAPTVQTDAANSLFAQRGEVPFTTKSVMQDGVAREVKTPDAKLSQAMSLATDTLERWPGLGAELTKTNLLILGHGAFAVEMFAKAETAYSQLLALPLALSEQTKISDGLLAAVYKQGELAEQANEPVEAVSHYLRLRSIDPAADLAAKGHFDAVAMVEASGDFTQSAELLRQFRQWYPNHPLAKDIDLRLAGLFEKTEDWQQAAVEYVNVANGPAEYDVRRQSLYRAAELYAKMGDPKDATTYFRQYAQSFPKPQDVALEAVHKLDEYAQQRGDAADRVTWLQRKIQIHQTMGRAATERATYLAASAALYFADKQRLAFEAIRLDHPLRKSLKDKTRELKKTVRAYESVADYKVAEFASASTYRIADLYAGLSRSIMASARPGNLSELELEQYEILLEEQAYPFEEQAITLHEINMRRSWEGVYDDWVKQSFTALSALMPARFDKSERQVVYVESIY